MSTATKYQILWGIIADPRLRSTPKLVAVVLLLKFLNLQTGQCNPSVPTIARLIGKCDRTVTLAINALRSSGWLVVRGTRGGSKEHTNQFDFRLRPTGEASCTGETDCTGEAKLGTGEAGSAEAVKPVADELSNEPSRTIEFELMTNFASKITVAGPACAVQPRLRDIQPTDKTAMHRVGRGLADLVATLSGGLTDDERRAIQGKIGAR
jgi:hypothetical protein